MRVISTPVLLCGCLLLAVGCVPGNTGGDPGTAGSNGAAGTTGPGNAGTNGAAGTNGTAGTTSNGGTIATAGSNGAAGTNAAAGTTGNAGRGGTTGNAGRGGTTGAAGTTGVAGTTGTGGQASCTFTVSSSTSTRIPTVGIVMWSTTLAGVTSASIDFGPTTSYGMTAPVNPAAASNNRTLLLGMKASRMYNFRITATSSAGSCQSQNYTIMTGALATGLMKPMLSPATASGLTGGFLITGQYVMGAGAGATAYILDADGDYVWWFSIGSNVTGARMNYAGTHMWINSANVGEATGNNSQNVHRVTMDGMMDENLSTQFNGLNHQLTVLPDETLAFYAYGSNGCDDVKEYSPTGTVKTVVNSRTALNLPTTTTQCHLNTIQYSRADDSLVFSNLQSSQIAKVKRSDGSTVWIMNGSTATITGVTWMNGNHGIHVLDLNRLLVFNNNSSAGQTSIVLEIMINGTTATRTWMYNGGQANMIMGDIQRMPNGNTIVGYSTRGVLHEVNASGQLLQSWTFGNSFGYIEKRASLYGPPPK